MRQTTLLPIFPNFDVQFRPSRRKMSVKGRFDMVTQQEDFLKLFVCHQAEIRAFLGMLIRDRHACEDVMQEVALVLWREFPRYDPARRFGAWARGIAANKVLQYREKHGRTAVVFSPEAIQAVVDAADGEESRTLPRLDALEQCVERLPERSRGLIDLRYGESLTLEQIAQELRSTADAVHKALSRLRLRLEDCVEQRLARNAD